MRRHSPLMVRVAPVLLAILSGTHALAAEPLYTNQPKFRIPFAFDAQEMARLRAVEIQLYVSTNQGRDWELAQSVPPSEARFTFEAKQDAQYWFAVRTLDAGNQRHPAGPLQPGLRVVVDRTAPELQVGLRESLAGEVELTWSADDEHLNLDTLQLEFLDPNQADWQPVAISVARQGRTAWNVPRTGRVQVRGRIADMAGNVRTAEATVVLGYVQEEAPGPRVPGPPVPTPDFSQPVAEGPSESSDLAARSEPQTVRSSLPVFGQPLIQPVPLQRDDDPQVVGAPQQPADPVPHPFSAPTEPNPIPPAETNLLHVNSTRFQLNYQFDEVGSSGVRDVKLYITEDNGNKWYVYGNDEDRESPFPVEVPEDGTYGFTLRVRSGIGFETPPPQPGQPPEMSVVVDRRPPQAELLPLEHVMDADGLQIHIQWRVADDKLAEEPVALYFASQAAGPWEPITGWSENLGEYTWAVGDHVPPNLYVRLEARDAAGNLTRVDSETPLVLDLTRPTARIVDVESIGGNEAPR